ncbi:MAG: heptosyltransferase [Verrucomicrobiota bacterium]|jgi:heptosyltransferase-2
MRGGAIGDFILTLPAIKALRDAYPHARIEILGYKHIAALAENRFYADAVRSIEYAPLSRFFAKNAKLSSELRDYFGSFDVIVSYLYDPDEIFLRNLQRCGARKILRGPWKIDNHSHAARQLARPVLELGIGIDDFVAKIFPSAQDRQFASDFLRGLSEPIVAIHPGSGSANKNWPIENWTELMNSIRGSIVVVSGEADEESVNRLQDRHVLLAKNLPLPQLAAVLERCVFVGHDSGISHLAAATGAKCVLLFGPTDPEVWAPLNDNVRVIRAATHRMEDVDLANVRQELMRIGMMT